MSTPPESPSQFCPCGKTARTGQPPSYQNCCGRFIDHFADTPAPDAASLMRSRYCAFVLGRNDYLLATWHASTRPAELQTDRGTKWLGLDVRRHVVIDGDHAEVEFVARYRTHGRGVRLHELSRFVRAQGRWYYVDGTEMN